VNVAAYATTTSHTSEAARRGRGHDAQTGISDIKIEIGSLNVSAYAGLGEPDSTVRNNVSLQLLHQYLRQAPISR
jgi:hypothetical protein